MGGGPAVIVSVHEDKFMNGIKIMYDNSMSSIVG